MTVPAPMARTTAPAAADLGRTPFADPTAGPLAGLTDPELHATDGVHELWQWMRTHAPVRWQPPTELPGFWSLTRHADIQAVYRDSDRFSSEQGVLLRPLARGGDPGGGLTLALTDPPRHRQLRGLMAGWFSTRGVRALEDDLASAVRTVLSRAAEWRACDFAQDIAGRLSHTLICRIMGVPESDHDQLYQWTNEAFEAHISLVAHPHLLDYFQELIYQRMEEPADDLLSELVHGTLDGRLLTEQEALLNCENLMGATENGRLAMIGGMLAMLEQPEQWGRLKEDPGLLPSAIEEILRWTSSATHSMRTATRDTVLRGRQIAAGERVVLWLPSANRDEAVFDTPYRFDIARRPNRHIALAAGAHFCIGSTLARAQMRALFGALAAPGVRIEPNGPAPRLRSLAVSGPERLPVRLTATNDAIRQGTDR